jgi:hypothetical protein
MGALGDNIDPIDEVLLSLSQSPTSEGLPMRMLCPAGHDVTRDLYRKMSVVIPFYPCEPCTIVYRFQECKLKPGDEGHSD